MKELEYNVYSKFDIDKHVETFINYLEVIIDENGEVYYAVPSHQEFLVHKLCKDKNITRNQLDDIVPRSYYCNYLKWLLIESNCVSVWNCGYMYGNSITKDQKKILNKFAEYGIMKNEEINYRY